MDIAESLLQDIMDWVELVTSLPHGRVIPVDDGGTRPALPYIDVKLMGLDNEIGSDETVYGVNSQDDLVAAVEGDREGTLTLNAYGRKGAELLAQCTASLRFPIVKRFMRDRKLAIRSAGATQDLSQLVADEREKRYAHDYFVGYSIRREQAEPEPHVENVEADIELNDSNITVEVN